MANQLHFVLFPFMAQGHMIPMIDIARLLAQRGVIITIVTTPHNAARFEKTLGRAIEFGLQIRLIQLQFPWEEAGLSEGCENFDLMPSLNLATNFLTAAGTLQQPVEKLFEELKPQPNCVISDTCLPYTAHIASKFNIPRISFQGICCFCLLCMHNTHVSKVLECITSDSEYFFIPSLPDRIEFTKPQIDAVPPQLKPLGEKFMEAELATYGVIVNSFEELEPAYVEEYSKVRDGKVWCIGPVSRYNRDYLDKAQRGNKASMDEKQILKWLDSQDSSSVLYACMGSLCNLIPAQLIELGLGLEASDRPFIWVIREGVNSKELQKWAMKNGFEERNKGRGLVIWGWAPQVLILSHPAIGGFLTHCGWNSCLEGISAGLPLITWPLFADQFCNEKLIVQILKIGVRVGVEYPTTWGEEEKIGVLVKREDVKSAVEKLMDKEKEAEERRERARELGKLAKAAVEEGGSSHLNIALLLEDIRNQGHMIPMIDIARLLAQRGVIITIVTTPHNAARFEKILARAIESGLQIRLIQLQFPWAEVGLSQGCENFDLMPSLDLALNFFTATGMLQEPVEKLFKELKPQPNCVISDTCLPYTAHIASKFNIPRISFQGICCFCLLCMHNTHVSKVLECITSDSEYFVIPSLPDRIEFTKPQIDSLSPQLKPLGEKFKEAELATYGVIVNSFEELEPAYVEEYSKVRDGKVWCIGPVSLYNRDYLDKAQRGNKASMDEKQILKWLDSQDSSSVLYACMGSLCNLIPAQLIELGLGLEASDRPFIWVIREGVNSKELQKWAMENGFEERNKGRGLVIWGWAPQVLILSHPAIGGFLTHCGWNSCLEGISAGLPLITWPLFADQFCNEKLIVQILKIGVRVGVEYPTTWGEEEKIGVLVKREDVKSAVEKLMDKEKEAEERRERARELGKLAKAAVEEGGSSHLNIALLLEDIRNQNEFASIKKGSRREKGKSRGLGKLAMSAVEDGDLLTSTLLFYLKISGIKASNIVRLGTPSGFDIVSSNNWRVLDTLWLEFNVRNWCKCRIDAAVTWGLEDKFGLLMKREQVKDAIQKVMDKGTQGEAKCAIEQGGSSYQNIEKLIQYVLQQTMSQKFTS
ncbi:hypothetical protein Dsin_006513 [Dipteronia sinensis]|uniref:Uncharacterized protein n=1 Tax=Dipteronia sinensis TaxID=43782 RepID=A0AAE0AYQ3_9ROSI|nr:hypothetical protein Dsin_006513 [Dipteronia sinensis]